MSCSHGKSRKSGRSRLFLVWRGVVDVGKGQGFFTFNAGAAFAAVLVITLVTAPCFGIVYLQPLTDGGNLAFGDVGVWGFDAYIDKGSALRCPIDGCDKLGGAIGIDGVVAGMVGDENFPEPVALCYADGYRQHDTITKGDYG